MSDEVLPGLLDVTCTLCGHLLVNHLLNMSYVREITVESFGQCRAYVVYEYPVPGYEVGQVGPCICVTHTRTATERRIELSVGDLNTKWSRSITS